MKKILIAILTCLPLFASAEWRTVEDIKKNVPNLGQTEFANYVDSEFFFSNKKCEKGFELFSMDKHFDCAVVMRVSSDLDICLDIFNPIWENAGKVYIALLDSDRYQIKKIHVGNITKMYTGKLFVTEKMNWDDMRRIKYFSLELFM